MTQPLAVAGSRLTVGGGAIVVAICMGLYAVALGAATWAIGLVDFPANEGSAYYVAVATNLVEGRGLVIDALWSYATPPLVLPRPAFELWQPLASFVAAGPMILLGTSFDAAQVGGAMLGALLAPLAALVARDAATALEVGSPSRRVWLAIGSGLIVALGAPLLRATALPDSTIPFAVASVAAALLLSRTLAGADASATRPALLLGGALGLAWLARHEAIWLGLTALLVAALAGRLTRRFSIPVAIGGLAVVTPWLVRNMVVFGTPVPGQTIDNVLLTANEQIYAFAVRPTLDAFLAQGPAQILANIGAGAFHNLFAVLVVPAAPAVIVGLAALPWLWRRRAFRATALAALVVSGALTYVIASIVFPVATLWGTFEHAAGPLLVGLSVAALIGLDRALAAVGRRRGWQRQNAWLSPLALIALTLPISVLMMTALAAEAARQADRTRELAHAVAAQPEAAAAGTVLISDHPIWLAEATGMRAIALPAEPLDRLVELAREFDARLVVVSGSRGEYPALLRGDAGRSCFEERIRPADSTSPGWPAGAAIFALRVECAR